MAQHQDRIDLLDDLPTKTTPEKISGRRLFVYVMCCNVFVISSDRAGREHDLEALHGHTHETLLLAFARFGA